MSGVDERTAGPGRAFRIITRVTRDVQSPLFEGGEDLARHGWRCIPLPPADPILGEGWEIFDDSKDYKTTWYRRCADHVAAARLGGPSGSMTARTRRRRQHVEVARPRRR